MKRVSVVLIVAVALVASACSEYSCPTYSKAPRTPTVAAKQVKG